MRRAVVFTLCAAAGAALAAGEPRFTVEADRGSFLAGEPVRLTLEVVAPRGVEVTFPGAGAPLGPFELVDRRLAPPDSLPGGEVRHAALLTVTAYEPGPVTLPALPALLRSPDGALSTVISDSLALEVESVLAAVPGAADSADIRPLKRPVELPGGHRLALLLLALAAGLGLAAFLVYRRRRRRAPAAAAPVALDTRPPDVIALEALERLRREGLAAHRVKAHYSRLTDILRPYLERRFGFPAVDLTTAEILEAVAARLDGPRGAAVPPPAPPPERDELRRLLEESDLVKFARFAPPPAIAEGAIDRAADFVRATAARFPAATAPPAAPEAKAAPAEMKA